MNEDFERAGLLGYVSCRQLWQDVDLEEMLEACERYLELAPLTEDRTVLMALVLRVRELGAAQYRGR